MFLFNSTLELVYWLALGIGLLVLAVSLVLGDIYDFFDIDIGDSGLPVVPVFFAALAAFGAGGLLGTLGFGLGRAGSIFSGIATGIGGGLGAGLLFFVLRRQESTEGFDMSKLVGERGRCTLAIGPNRTGRVAVSYRGMTRSLTAISDEEIAAGEQIVVTDVVGHTIEVRRPDRAAAPGPS